MSHFKQVTEAKRVNKQPAIYAVDLFCGIGGLTYGLRKAGICVRAGIDSDSSCRSAYERNNTGADFVPADIRRVSPNMVSNYYSGADVKVLVGCAPCQPFSAHTRKHRRANGGDDCSLLKQFARIAAKTRPDIISIENVPGLARHNAFAEFIRTLKNLGYDPAVHIVNCPEYGIPQTRKRLVMLASRLGKISLVPPTHKDKKDWPTVGKFIKGMQPLKHGGMSETDPCHVSLRLSDTNLKRIRQSKPGGCWHDWDKKLVADCQREAAYPAPYGRMQWNSPAPTITTQFCYYSTGRFGHPSQNRAISIREGALLQTFPKGYKFQNRENPLTPREMARHIGNAVPVSLGKAIGRSIRRHACSVLTA